jgi:hypothetical protein
MSQVAREDQRKARLAAALRENLKRRKAQDRGRSEAAADAHSHDRVRETPAGPQTER